MVQCANEESLNRFFSDSLSESENQSLINHLGECLACRKRVDQLSSDGKLRKMLQCSQSCQSAAFEVSIPDILRDRLYGLYDSQKVDSRFAYEHESKSETVNSDGKSVATSSVATSEVELNKTVSETVCNSEFIGKYRVGFEIGHGATGTVFEAVHTKLNKKVAFKILEPRRTLKLESVERFHREIRSLAQLDHPNIVKALDAGDEDGAIYLVMELIDGENLADIVHKIGPLPIVDACEIAVQVASGLQHAHKSGFTHRDIKPSNLMISAEGNVKILDLGLSRFRGEDGVRNNLTQTGCVIGTLPFMAPERFDFQDNDDIRADLYSLGCTLYCFLTGDTPFSGEGFGTPAQQMKAHVDTPVPPIQNLRPEVPDALAAVMDRLLAKDPAARFQLPEEVVEALQPFTEENDLAEILRTARQTFTIEAATGSTVSVIPAPCSTQQTTVPVSPSNISSRGRIKVRRLFLFASTLFFAVFGSVIYVNTGEGMLEIRINDADSRITIDGKDRPLIEVESADGRYTLTLPAGKHLLEARKDGFITETRNFSIARNGREEVSVKLISSAGDRGAAVLVLRSGGKVKLDGGGTVLRSENELPDKDFRISEILMEGVTRAQISDEMLKALFKGFKNLQSLENLHLGKSRVTDEEMKYLNGIENLFQLNLQWTSVTDSGLESLTNLPNLQNLWIDETEITNQGLESLQRFKKLRGLALKGTNISDQGILHLIHLKKLAGLHLDRTQISSASVEHLQQFSNLQYLGLRGTSLTGDDLHSLQKSLPLCEIVK